ncbi:hypothetical protein V5E97_24385 [Singulisphaera sp. Ch08]|uniref:Uncharacterized protein n=1 Tax=Singulisphaera sp. Ch08 TaxID=3120278 RepID=A0AAU7C8K5_9BACT
MKHPERLHAHHNPTLRPPPPLTTPPSPPLTTPTVWARLSSDRQRQIRDLFGRLLARVLAASCGEEVGHE